MGWGPGRPETPVNSGLAARPSGNARFTRSSGQALRRVSGCGVTESRFVAMATRDSARFSRRRCGLRPPALIRTATLRLGGRQKRRSPKPDTPLPCNLWHGRRSRHQRADYLAFAPHPARSAVRRMNRLTRLQLEGRDGKPSGKPGLLFNLAETLSPAFSAAAGLSGDSRRRRGRALLVFCGDVAACAFWMRRPTG